MAQRRRSRRGGPAARARGYGTIPNERPFGITLRLGETVRETDALGHEIEDPILEVLVDVGVLAGERQQLLVDAANDSVRWQEKGSGRRVTAPDRWVTNPSSRPSLRPEPFNRSGISRTGAIAKGDTIEGSYQESIAIGRRCDPALSQPASACSLNLAEREWDASRASLLPTSDVESSSAPILVTRPEFSDRREQVAHEQIEAI